MENIFENTLEAVENGASFRVDFSERTLKVNGKLVVKNRDYEGDLGVELCQSCEDFLDHVEVLYRVYKHSVPSEKSESKHDRYFNALPEYKLSDDDMMYGVRRDVAQVELEMFILFQFILGFSWNQERMGKWFWQGKDKDLVMLKEWFEPVTTNN